VRKERSYTDRVANGSNRPFAALQDRPSERDGSARERGLRIKARRCTRGGYSATTARLPLKVLTTKPEAGRERIITVLGPCPSHSTNWPARARGAGSAARTRTGRARRIFGRPHRLVRERERNMSRMDSQSNELLSWCSPTACSSDFPSACSASGAP
jgi:hypothetical protein